MSQEEYIKKFTVKIIGETSIGTGIVVTPNGMIMTCFHVIGNVIDNLIHSKMVKVYFPESKITKIAEVKEENCDNLIDIAYLQLLDKELPGQSTVAYLSENLHSSHGFKCYGFRKPDEFEGLFADIRVIGKTRKISDNIDFGQEVIQIHSDGIEEGMSGSGILDLETNLVAGIVFAHYDTQGTVDISLNFAIPITFILKSEKTPADLKYNNPGLNEFYNFLLDIGKNQSGLYNRFEDVYTPPLEYEEIQETLKENRCVFITGTPEYGKTFTAIRILFEYYKSGFIAKHIEEGLNDSEKIIKKLRDQDQGLKKNIIFFEDPIGKTDYVVNKEFEESIETIIYNLEILDVYVIVTMREELYSKFNPLGKEDLKKYVKKLDIGNKSYDYERRKQMMLRWASVLKCRWLENDELKNIVLDLISSESNLPTPLNIKDFAIASNKIYDITSKDKMSNLVKRLSGRTSERFAKEIEEIQNSSELYKIVFLSFPLIYGGLSIEFVKSIYNEIMNNLELTHNSLKSEGGVEFDMLLQWFKDEVNRVDISHGFLIFTHPSYSEALNFLLSPYKKTSITTKILCMILERLACTKDFLLAGRLVEIILDNFNNLPLNSVKNILFQLIENNETAHSVVIRISYRFDNLSEEIRNELILSIINSERGLVTLAYDLYAFWDKLPSNLREIVFKKLIAHEETSSIFVGTLLLALITYDPKDVKYGIAIDYLYFLTESKEMAIMLSRSIYAERRLWDIPENIRYNLLVKLMKYNETAIDISSAIGIFYDKASDNVKNLLFRLASDKETSNQVSMLVDSYLDNLPTADANELIKILKSNNNG